MTDLLNAFSVSVELSSEGLQSICTCSPMSISSMLLGLCRVTAGAVQARDDGIRTRGPQAGLSLLHCAAYTPQGEALSCLKELWESDQTPLTMRKQTLRALARCAGPQVGILVISPMTEMPAVCTFTAS